MTYKTALQAIILGEAKMRIYRLIEDHPTACVDGLRSLDEIKLVKTENSYRVAPFRLNVYDNGLLCRYRVKGDIYEDGTIWLDLNKEETC